MAPKKKGTKEELESERLKAEEEALRAEEGMAEVPYFYQPNSEYVPLQHQKVIYYPLVPSSVKTIGEGMQSY
jgi:hypothetical protein